MTTSPKIDLSRLENRRGQLNERLEGFKRRALKLDMTRGKPSVEQLDLSAGLLSVLGPSDYRAADGTDCRNYGILEGLPEARRLFAPILDVGPDDVLVAGNSSLALMHDTIAQALLRPLPDAREPWRALPSVKFLCPSPGYDRHFAICDYLGIAMETVEMRADGPDMNAVEEIVASDPTVKGIWCVPRYSNPTGIVYAAETVRGLARMKTAAPDFRIIWDNAYAVHHLYPDPAPLANIAEECNAAGHPDRPFLVTSTSKITFAGAGMSAIAGSDANMSWFRASRMKRTIGSDKLVQLRHVRFLPDRVALDAHMAKHAAILRPKFEAVLEILERELGGSGVATWTRPRGGYFISLDVPDDCAKRTVERAKEAGVKLTGAGATFPRGRDPRNRNIRIAPSFPPLAELRQATEILALAVLLVAAESGVDLAAATAGATAR